MEICLVSTQRGKFSLLVIVTVSFIFIALPILPRFHGHDVQIANLGTSFECKYHEIAQKLGRLQRHDAHSSDIIFTIKTAKIFHQTRLELVLKTWYKLVKKQVSKYLKLKTMCFLIFLQFVFHVCIQKMQ